MHHVILTAANGPLHPQIKQIDAQRGVNPDGRMQRIRWLPGAVADARNEFSHTPRRTQRQAPLIAGDRIAIRRKPADLDLQALHGGIHIAHSAAGGALFRP